MSSLWFQNSWGVVKSWPKLRSNGSAQSVVLDRWYCWYSIWACSADSKAVRRHPPCDARVPFIAPVAMLRCVAAGHGVIFTLLYWHCIGYLNFQVETTPNFAPKISTPSPSLCLGFEARGKHRMSWHRHTHSGILGTSYPCRSILMSPLRFWPPYSVLEFLSS